MRRRWTEQQSFQLWNARIWTLIGRDDNTANRCARFHEETRNREERHRADMLQFAQDNGAAVPHPNAEAYLATVDAENLAFWAVHGSTTYCANCNKLLQLRLLSRWSNRPKVSAKGHCTCVEGRYFTPQPNEVPVVLRNLSNSEICSLRPLTVHTGQYIRLENGYRKKAGTFRLSWSRLSVVDQIQALQDDLSRQRVMTAYHHLMREPQSSYKFFVDQRERSIALGHRFNLYDYEQRCYVECCLWPNLYPTREWCETHLDGRGSRLSSKAAFMVKVHSSIADYGLNYELLHFHYDLWLFKTVSGAISAGRSLFCSPARSLETKPFSTDYWKWQHRFLVDAVLQHGPPSLFVTISPFEWTFPIPPWLTALREVTGRGPTQLAAYETQQIAHVLTQVIRGYLCGSNDNKWTNHVFSYNRLPAYTNVKTYFYRFEFQNRGTVHVHLLVWLKDLTRIRLPLLRGDIPWSDPALSFQVTTLQKSDKRALSLTEDRTEVFASENGQILRLHHPADAFARNLRGYISSLIPSLRCRMDVQTSDGRSMILKYVTSYVSKWQDSYSNDALYSAYVGPNQAAYKHLSCLKPLEPEMWLALSSTKVSWTNSRRKKIAIPTIDRLDDNVQHQKYLDRPAVFNDFSLLQWLRAVDETKTPPRPYNDHSTLVGVKTVSSLKDLYFFQFLLLNFPHRSNDELYHRDHDNLPIQIKHFACAYTLMNDTWSSSEQVRSLFSQQGHKETFVQTMVSHVDSLTDLFHLWQRRVLTGIDVTVAERHAIDAIRDPIQNQALLHIKACLRKRDDYYDRLDPTLVEDAPDDDDETDDNLQDNQQRHIAVRPPNPTDDAVDWRKFVLLTGKPGTGKTHCVHKAMDEALDDERQIMVATPTGFLATTYANVFGTDITTDTVHSAFKYPVARDQQAEVNWDLGHFDVLVLDEISMIPKRIADHIIQTVNQLPTRPVVVMCGDNQQQQPFESSDQTTRPTTSILQHSPFYSMVQHFHLTTQYRCHDPLLQQILNHLRYYRPSQKLLDTIHAGRVISTNHEPTDEEISTTLRQYSASTILTVTCAGANKVNRIAVETLFRNETPLCRVQCDCDLPPIPIYRNMSVIITQNRDKPNGVVNGQRASVYMSHRNTVFLRLPDGFIANMYPVTSNKADGTRRTAFPFVPAYALTICKSQGQTLPNIVIWMDSMFVPPGAAYVALSRVRKLHNLRFLSNTYHYQYTPVNLD